MLVRVLWGEDEDKEDQFVLLGTEESEYVLTGRKKGEKKVL